MQIERVDVTSNADEMASLYIETKPSTSTGHLFLDSSTLSYTPVIEQRTTKIDDRLMRFDIIRKKRGTQ